MGIIERKPCWIGLPAAPIAFTERCHRNEAAILRLEPWLPEIAGRLAHVGGVGALGLGRRWEASSHLEQLASGRGFPHHRRNTVGKIAGCGSRLPTLKLIEPLRDLRDTLQAVRFRPPAILADKALAGRARYDLAPRRPDFPSMHPEEM